jgi:hypothetical protein
MSAEGAGRSVTGMLYDAHDRLGILVALGELDRRRKRDQKRETKES